MKSVPVSPAVRCLLVGSALFVAGCGATSPPVPGSAGTTSPAASSPLPQVSQTPAPMRSSAWPVVAAVPPVRAGLHQTGRRPVAPGHVFAAEMTDLWAAVVAGRPRLGLAAFFPLVGYLQVKAIANPAADWRNRLVAEFNLDVMAAHSLLGRQARHATLVRVIVPESQASWIVPGVCSNGVGYWHVAEARLVYRAGGQERSIGIASLISWRGIWYVVHFGAVIRTTGGGVVDQPAVGPGVPGPPGGC